MKKYIKGIGIYAVLLLVIFAAYSFMSYSAEPETIGFSELVNSIDDGKVKEIKILEDEATVTLNDGKVVMCEIQSSTVLYAFAGENISKQMEKGTLKVEIMKPTTPPWWVTMLPSLLFIIIIIVFWVFFFKQTKGGGHGTMNFGKSHAKIHMSNKPIDYGRVICHVDIEIPPSRFYISVSYLGVAYHGCRTAVRGFLL